jgi:hypothetical protein
MWLRQVVIDATDHVALVAECFQTYFSLDIAGATTPQSVFCAPRELFKMDRVVVTLSSGSKVSLKAAGGQIVTPARADELYPGWDTNPASGSTPSIVIDRQPDLILYPLPNWDATAGAVFHGWGVPGDWAGTGVAAPTDPFPLPEYARMAVVYWAQYLRCSQFIKEPGNRERMPILHAAFEDQVGLIASKRATDHGRFS